MAGPRHNQQFFVLALQLPESVFAEIPRMRLFAMYQQDGGMMTGRGMAPQKVYNTHIPPPPPPTVGSATSCCGRLPQR